MSSNEWREVRIKDICTRIVSGGTPSRKKPEYYINGRYPWVKTQELKDCNLYETEEQITDDALNNSSAKICLLTRYRWLCMVQRLVNWEYLKRNARLIKLAAT